MTSVEDQGNQKEEYLIDFLYVDRARIQTLSSQLFENGHLTHTKQSTSTSEAAKIGIQGGIPGIVKGKGDHNESFSESVERQFDATWSSTLDVLRELNEKEYLVQDIEHSLLGQIVQLKGNIQINDLRMLEKLWQPMIKINSAQLLNDAKGAEKAIVKKQIEQNTNFAKILELLPHMLIMRMWNSRNAAWSTIEPEYLTINPMDLVFKHGALIPGEWIIVAILDAKPSNIEDDYLTAQINSGSGLTGMMPDLLKSLREGLGRNPEDFGVTPIAIYRKVTRR